MGSCLPKTKTINRHNIGRAAGSTWINTFPHSAENRVAHNVRGFKEVIGCRAAILRIF